ncbi:hypothetical protein ACXR0O_24430 [Verrucomicrobiota bacterium sgz303538]
MKSRILHGTVCVLIFAATVLAVFYFSPPGREYRRIRHHMDELRSARDVREVALECLSLLQSTTEQTLIISSADSRVPAAIRSKKPSSLVIAPISRKVTIEFGGGFFHYGYRLEPVSSGAGQWSLSMYGEREDDVRELIRL